MKQKLINMWVIRELYKYYRKWYSEELKSYKGKIDFYSEYMSLIERNPRSIYEFIISTYDMIIKNEDLRDKTIRNKLQDTTNLVLKIGMYYGLYKDLKCNSNIVRCCNTN